MSLVTRESLIALLNHPNRNIRMMAIGRALVRIKNRQTSSEQTTGQTINHNGIGFTPADAKRGTSMAKWFEQHGFLTPKQMEYWTKPNAKGVPRLAKYWRQLNEEAEAKKYAKEYKVTHTEEVMAA